MRSASLYICVVMVIFGAASSATKNETAKQSLAPETTLAPHVTPTTAPADPVAFASSAPNDTIPLSLLLQRGNFRRKSHRYRSTSSSSGEKDKNKKEGESEHNKESLGISVSSSESDSKSGSKKKNKYVPKSSAERKGWRKWHRKCPPCPELKTPWRHPSLQWVCGGYQRARRSFKSVCMMRYRNCQDGTMFVLIHRHRCEPSSAKERPFGEHFFYDYRAAISGDSTDSEASSEPASEDSSSD